MSGLEAKRTVAPTSRSFLFSYSCVPVALWSRRYGSRPCPSDDHEIVSTPASRMGVVVVVVPCCATTPIIAEWS